MAAEAGVEMASTTETPILALKVVGGTEVCD
jgi:hypothetical protein